MMSNNYKFSQDYEVIPPQKQKVYPISIKEWIYIKTRIKNINDGANLYHTIGSILIGAAVTTLITALINDFKTPQLLWTCWAAFIVTTICGGLAFYFGSEQRKVQNKSAIDVVEQMELIEDRYAESADKLIIHTAIYGRDKQTYDVTTQLISLIVDNKLTIVANNEIAGDPYHGVEKKLTVDYTLDGQREAKTVNEGETLTIE